MLSNIIRKFSGVALNKFLASGVSIPAAEKKVRGGEDAFYIDSNILTIADGVGGWIEYDIDSGFYARELVKQIGLAYDSAQEKTLTQEIIRVASWANKEIGSSTCCTVILDPNESKIYTGIVGDSGFYLFRLKDNKLETIELEFQSSSGRPNQLGTYGDNPSRGKYSTIQVENNDILVLFTDGLFENIFDHEITSIIEPFIKSSESPDFEKIAEVLCSTAENFSLSRRHAGPYNSFMWKGGRPDDITAVVARIVLKNNNS